MHEIDRTLELLEELENPASNGREIDDIENELIRLVRLTGAGAFGSRGSIYRNMKATVESDTDRKQALIRFMTGKSPLVRSWAGSFVEQLFEEEESVPLLGKALRKESDPEAAS